MLLFRPTWRKMMIANVDSTSACDICCRCGVPACDVYVPVLHSQLYLLIGLSVQSSSWSCLFAVNPWTGVLATCWDLRRKAVVWLVWSRVVVGVHHPADNCQQFCRYFVFQFPAATVDVAVPTSVAKLRISSFCFSFAPVSYWNCCCIKSFTTYFTYLFNYF